MFKRIEKKRRKREEEEKLGLDENMKEILGIHDTDSDESSDSEPDSDSRSNLGGSRSSKEPEEEESDAPRVDRTNDRDTSVELEGEEDSVEGIYLPPISVREALNDPIYVVSAEPNINGCVVCPGKILKNTRMTTVHKMSNAHQRRFSQFTSAVSRANPNDDAWNFAIKKIDSKSVFSASDVDSVPSKRSAKRKAREAAIKLKRDKHKAAKAKARARRESEKSNAPVTQEVAKISESITSKRRREEEDQSKHPKKRGKIRRGVEQAKIMRS